LTGKPYNSKSGVLLQVDNLRLNFHTYAGEVKALDGVTFTVKEDEVLGLVGESGCGKSVTALAIVRLLPENAYVAEGKILLEGQNLLNISQNEMRKIRAHKIAMVFQDPTTFLNPVLTIGEQLEEVVLLTTPDRLTRVTTASEQSGDLGSGNEKWIKRREDATRPQTSPELPRSERKKAASVDVLKQVRLPDPLRTLGQYPHELSGGMRQRCMIAMALVRNPILFIADEITTALDVTVQAQILELLRELKHKLIGSTLLITHDLGVVAELCDRVAVMYAGNIVEIAEVNELFAKPLHPYTQGLMRAIPIVGRPLERLETIQGSVPDLIHPPSGCRFHPRCPFVFEKCRVEKPQLLDAGEEHKVACHLYGEKNHDANCT
jgi:oligopeptide/dipeptide ABC transporter ATP-binding protein